MDDAYKTVDPLFQRIESDKELASLTRGEQAAYAVLTLEGQVNNGGFSQFFFNTGEYADEALTGLRLIGAREYERLLERAIAQFPGCDPPDDVDAIRAELERLGERELQIMDAVDVRFFELEEEKTPADYVAEYMSRHPAEFELARG